MCHDQHLHVAVVTERKMDKVMNLKSEIFTCSTWATQTFRSCLNYYWLRYGSFSRARKLLKRFLSDTLYLELAIPSAGRIFRARSLSRYWCDIPDIWLFVFVQCCACKVNRQPWIFILGHYHVHLMNTRPFPWEILEVSVFIQGLVRLSAPWHPPEYGVSQWSLNNSFGLTLGHISITPWARVGYEMVNSQRDA